jgi:hypothetical protein
LWRRKNRRRGGEGRGKKRRLDEEEGVQSTLLSLCLTRTLPPSTFAAFFLASPN